jgi:hypothetical protein
VRPNVLIAGIEATTRVARIAKRRTTINTAENKRTLLNLFSDLSIVLFTDIPLALTTPFEFCTTGLFIA